VLGNGHQDGLMVSSGVDRRHFVETGRKASSNISSQDTAYGSGVQALEEDELLGVGRGGLVEGRELLDDDVGVTDDLTLTVDLLGSSEVVLLCVDEGTGLEVGDGHLDGERCVLSDGLAVGGELEFR